MPATQDLQSGEFDSCAISRTPVFDRQRRVLAYEITLGDEASIIDEDALTQRARKAAWATVHAVGLDAILGTTQGLMPCTATMIDADEHLALPPERVTLLVQHPPGSGNDLKAWHKAIEHGYKIAVHADELDKELYPLLDSTSIVLVQHSGQVERPANVGRHVATGVRTQQDFDRAMDIGFAAAQGWFFCQPELVNGRAPRAVSASCVRFLSLVSASRLDFDAVEAAIKNDLGLTHALLRQVNASATGVRSRIGSVRQAITMLGERRLRAWGALTVLGSIAAHKPSELLNVALLRARFCELAAHTASIESGSGFLVGLLSLLDAATDQPMERAIEPLPLDDDVRHALMGARDHGLGAILALAEASERGAWSTVRQIGTPLGINQRQATMLYFQAMQACSTERAA